MNNDDIEDAVILEDRTPSKKEEIQQEPKQAPGAFMTPQKLMSMLKKMVDEEEVTPEQARNMRHQFGINQSFFTSKKLSKQEKKKKRATVKASRRVNRQRGRSK